MWSLAKQRAPQRQWNARAGECAKNLYVLLMGGGWSFPHHPINLYPTNPKPAHPTPAATRRTEDTSVKRSL